MNMREALARARAAGCEVTLPRRTGEVMVVSPSGERTRASLNRKDTPRKLVALVARAERAASNGGA